MHILIANTDYKPYIGDNNWKLHSKTICNSKQKLLIANRCVFVLTECIVSYTCLYWHNLVITYMVHAYNKCWYNVLFNCIWSVALTLMLTFIETRQYTVINDCFIASARLRHYEGLPCLLKYNISVRLFKVWHMHLIIILFAFKLYVIPWIFCSP